jgi:hypothetical protein
LQPFQPKLHMTDADFFSITRNVKCCDDDGGLGEREFELVMREQVVCPLASARTGHDRELSLPQRNKLKLCLPRTLRRFQIS